MTKALEPNFDSFLRDNRSVLETTYKAGVAAGDKQGHERGFKEGFTAGRFLGTIEGMNALTPAVSDGLRHGSPVCGSAMRSMRKLGLDTPDK
jgi:flagellar biosynthesis/type III secretory pathway protein FliH